MLMMKSKDKSVRESLTIKDEIPIGSVRWFEYHCLESPASSDAKLWYRSHQRVTVGFCENPEYGEFSQQERYEEGIPLAYQVTFSDGFIGTAMEDELLNSKASSIAPTHQRRKTLGYTTDFSGHFDLDKALSGTMAKYLNMFSETRRMRRNPEEILKLKDGDRNDE